MQKPAPGSLVSPIDEANCDAEGYFLCWQVLMLDLYVPGNLIGSVNDVRLKQIRHHVSCLLAANLLKELEFDFLRCLPDIGEKVARGDVIRFTRTPQPVYGIVVSNSFANSRRRNVVIAIGHNGQENLDRGTTLRVGHSDSCFDVQFDGTIVRACCVETEGVATVKKNGVVVNIGDDATDAIVHDFLLRLENCE